MRAIVTCICWGLWQTGILPLWVAIVSTCICVLTAIAEVYQEKK